MYMIPGVWKSVFSLGLLQIVELKSNKKFVFRRGKGAAVQIKVNCEVVSGKMHRNQKFRKGWPEPGNLEKGTRKGFCDPMAFFLVYF